MAEKRRDNKGRLLRQGEVQRNDGKYEYKYFDIRGERRSIYSWRLVDTDRLPNGKRACQALRDMIKEAQRDVEDRINSYDASRTTLNQFFDDYIETKYELKPVTRIQYKYMYGKFVRDIIGHKGMADIKYSDIKKYYIHLIRNFGLKPASIELVHSIIHPVFSRAVKDGLIRQSPTNGVIAELKKGHDWEKTKRHALTEAQQSAFVDFIKGSGKYKHWLPLFTVLLGTGCRVGEVIGFRWQYCDFAEKIITIDHSLAYHRREDGSGYGFHISTPKTRAGNRIIPMFSAVKQALLEERMRQMQTGFNETEVDGYSGFIFLTHKGDCLTYSLINRTIGAIIRDHNACEIGSAKKEKRQPELLPHFSVHNLRHTFCTRFCENETNLKIIQEIMGHADISTTMNIYNEATMEKKQESFANLEGKVKIS